MDTLRSKVIRLAHGNPELRPHLLPLLKTASRSLDQLRADLEKVSQVSFARNVQNNRRYTPEQKAKAVEKADAILQSGEVDYLLKISNRDTDRLTDILTLIRSGGPRIGTAHSKAEDDAERYVRELEFLSKFCTLPEMVPVDRQLTAGKFHTRDFGGLDTLAQRIQSVNTENQLSREDSERLLAEWRSRTFGPDRGSDPLNFGDRYRD
jgi:hypothetical protein